MAEGGAVSECYFRWHIFNPFVLSRRFKAIFYHGSGTLFLTEWKVILYPVVFDESNDATFRFAIRCIRHRGRREIIKIRRIKVGLCLEPLNRGHIRIERFAGYDFSVENKFVKEIKFQSLTKRDITELIFNLEMDFPHEPPEENEPVFRHCDLKELSNDLGELQRSGRYTDLILKAKDSDQAFPVHKFMLDARWNNFFTEHSIIDPEVQTGISQRILTRILDYIYQGKGRQIPRVDVEKNELFEVIDKYQLHHLYKTFISEDSQQERRTYQDGCIFRRPYLLDYTTLAPNYEWIPALGHFQHDFRLNIIFYLTRHNLQFTYLLESRSPLKLFAELTLEMVQERIVAPITRKVRQFHFKKFVFEPYGTKHGKRPEFEGDRSVVLDYIESLYPEAARREFKYSFIFHLTLSTGRQFFELRATGRKYSFQEDKKMLDVLSTHMIRCWLGFGDHDFRVSCPGANGRETHRLHKAIFAARVHNYWDVLEGVEEGSEIPDEAECTLSSLAFRYVLRFIYTGKVDSMYVGLLEEIADFAYRGGIHGLNALALKRISETRRR